VTSVTNRPRNNALIKGWVSSTSEAGAWATVQKFNLQHPPAARITMAQLQQAKPRADTAESSGCNYMGLKQQQFIADRDRALYQ
jgi:hypothetical protein